MQLSDLQVVLSICADFPTWLCATSSVFPSITLREYLWGRELLPLFWHEGFGYLSNTNC